MDEILERLLSEASEQFGPRRSAELEPVLTVVARDLADLAQYPLEQDDVP